jgi:hypothetical protein
MVKEGVISAVPRHLSERLVESVPKHVQGVILVKGGHTSY